MIQVALKDGKNNLNHPADKKLQRSGLLGLFVTVFSNKQVALT